MSEMITTDRESQSGRILPQWASVNRVVLDLFHTYEPAFMAKRLGTGLDLDPLMPLTWGDRAQLRHGLSGLLSHAVKHSTKGGLVLCRTALEGEWVKLVIGDNGPGLSADEAFNLFKSGVGTRQLGMAQEIIAAHGGQIAFDSSNAKGAWFIVRLPGIAMENERLSEELEESRRGGLDLVAKLSYDLRTPLHAILGYADLLIDNTFGELTGEQTDTVARIEQGAHDMLGLIDGAIDLRHGDGSQARLDDAQAHLPERLRGFCQLAIDVLECDFSYAFVWQPAADAFIPVASAASPSAGEVWSKGLRVSNIQMRRAMAKDSTGSASVVAAEPREVFGDDVVSRLGLERCVLLPVRREREMVGVLVVCYRGTPRPFTAEHVQFAEGIGDLAGLAVENAMLSEQLDESERVMNEFIASMSHRSRIPLNIIIGYSDLLYEGEFGGLSPEQMGVAERLRRSGRELLAAINNNLLPGQGRAQQYDA